MNEKIFASDITKALSRRHTDDFYMTEVKDGPTQYGSHMRLDAVAIAKSWSHPCITGYEVKVSRSDWLADQKWEFYVPLCHRFSIAAVAGVVKDGEVPDGVGWYEYIQSSGGLRVKQKPVHRNITPDSHMLLYIIMNRIQSDRIPFYTDREALIRDYLEGKKTAREIGYKLSQRLSDQIYEGERIRRDMDRLKEQQEDEHKAIMEIQEIVRLRGGSQYVPGLSAEIDRMLKGDISFSAARMLDDIVANAGKLKTLLQPVQNDEEVS